jgi:hypothetical protein
MNVTSIARFERLFRAAAGLDVDKEDLRRYLDFVQRKTGDLLLRAQAVAKANARDVIEPWDLPITKGLQECMHAFRVLDQQVEVRSILEGLPYPPLDLAYAQEIIEKLPETAGGLSIALARSFKIVTPGLKNPQTVHWEQAFSLFDLIL